MRTIFGVPLGLFSRTQREKHICSNCRKSNARAASRHTYL